MGALGITPIDFVLPLAMYIFLRKPKGWKLWLNWTLMVFYICIMIIGAVAAIRGIVLDACKAPLHSIFIYLVAIGLLYMAEPNGCRQKCRLCRQK